MPQDLSKKKSDVLSQIVAFAPKAEALARNIAELNSNFVDNGFATAGTNAIVDADCIGENSHMTAALANSAIAALLNINLTPAQKATLRQVSRTVIPV